MRKYTGLKALRQDRNVQVGYKQEASVEEIYEYIKSKITDLGNVNIDFIDIPFMYYYGGYIFIVEIYDDLVHIKTWKELGDYDYKSIIEASDCFDICESISENFYQVYNVTNNLLYFIDK